ncbi:MAG: hypothetical protein KKB50_13955 [Planctomycetes bacterium]|nr:hypothetical protein [Planctomycetota bacterium]
MVSTRRNARQSRGAPRNAYQVNDYHLTTLSPCIDTGDPAFVAQPDEGDLEGELRVWDADGDGTPRVDMGVDEFGSFRYGDLDCDGDINGFDIDAFVLALQGPAYYDPVLPDCDHILADVNRDGEVNGFDIDAFVELLIGGWAGCSWGPAALGWQMPGRVAEASRLCEPRAGRPSHPSIEP